MKSGYILLLPPETAPKHAGYSPFEFCAPSATAITLPPDAPTDGKLRVSLVGKDGAALVDDVRRYALKQPKNLSSAGHRRLNNFVTETFIRLIVSPLF